MTPDRPLDGTGTVLIDGHPFTNVAGPSFGPTTGLTLHIGPHISIRGGGDFGYGYGSSCGGLSGRRASVPAGSLQPSAKAA